MSRWIVTAEGKAYGMFMTAIEAQQWAQKELPMSYLKGLVDICEYSTI